MGTAPRDAAWLWDLAEAAGILCATSQRAHDRRLEVADALGENTRSEAIQRQVMTMIDSVRVYGEGQVLHTRRRPHKVADIWEVTVLVQPGKRLDLDIRGKVDVLLFEAAVKTDRDYTRDSAKSQYSGHIVFIKSCLRNHQLFQRPVFLDKSSGMRRRNATVKLTSEAIVEH
ncbi:hypothetical protein CKAH01_10459 [Colletotrichum kahawae]|uniref:Uncharacterized protein n=1 Tax=Colletotrichum kahawae TaxID=34407 RepID=A0AAD9XX68_COLKA|nr:hypothetical protein CKAH01_10459 [Colletotrichum kahawae]